MRYRLVVQREKDRQFLMNLATKKKLIDEALFDSLESLVSYVNQHYSQALPKGVTRTTFLVYDAQNPHNVRFFVMPSDAQQLLWN